MNLKANPERTLSVIQIGITLAGAIAAAVEGAGAEETLTPYFQKTFGVSENWAGLLAIASVVVPITYLSVVIGELVPKSTALRNATSIAVASAPGLILLDRGLSPIVTLIEKSTRLILYPFQESRDLMQKSESEALETEEAIELDAVSRESRASLLRHSRLEFLTAEDAMRPWHQVVWIKKEIAPLEIRKILVETGYTRLPVFHHDGVIGILHTEEFLALNEKGLAEWERLIRSPLHIQKKTPLPRVLSLLQKERRHMAIVLDHHQLIGEVTIEDIIEEVFGSMADERGEFQVQKLLARRK